MALWPDRTSLNPTPAQLRGYPTPGPFPTGKHPGVGTRGAQQCGCKAQRIRGLPLDFLVPASVCLADPELLITHLHCLHHVPLLGQVLTGGCGCSVCSAAWCLQRYFQEADAISLLLSQESSLLADLWRGHNTDLLLPLPTQTEFMSREKVRDHLILQPEVTGVLVSCSLVR